MDDKQIPGIITACESFLNRSRDELKKILSDRRVMEWGKVNFHKHTPILTAFNVPATLHGARDRVGKTIGKLAKRFDYLENDIGNLKADFSFATIASAESQGRARTLETNFESLKKDYTAFAADAKLLRESYTRLQENLSVEPLLPLARETSGKTPAFDIGLQLYRFIADEEDDKAGTKTLAGYFREAVKLGELFANISLPGLPALAVTVIKEQTKTAREAPAAIKDCLDIISENLAVEQRHLETIKDRISQLKSEPLPELLKKIDIEIEAIYRCILRFHYKSYTMEKIYAVEELEETLRFLQRTIKNELLKELKAESNNVGSPINPATLASSAADSFLHGLSGFVRGIRILIRLLLGRPTVNLVNFQNILQNAIQTCDTFYGNTPTDITKLEDFIADKLKEYDSPFPRNALFSITKNCLHKYGSAVESFTLSFKVELPVPTKGNKSASLERILRKVATSIEDLQK